MRIHAIAGLPRSGSTLLCNVLNQNPRFFASSTSCMAQTARTISHLWSNSPEMKSELINDRENTEQRMIRAAQALFHAWYKDKGEVIFDKCRFWNGSAAYFQQLFPGSQLIVCVRDLRAIFASVEKQHAKFPMFDEAGNHQELTTYNRADRMFSPQGLIGAQIMGIEDLLRRNLRTPEGKPFVHAVPYEGFSQNPQLFIDRIYEAVEEEPFKHDFENVEASSGSTDVDGLYLNKFPHIGTGKVEPSPDDWRNFVSQDIAQLIMQKFGAYNQAFGYR